MTSSHSETADRTPVDPRAAAVAAKTGFDHVYNQADPRDYYHALVSGLDYEEPAHCARIVNALLPHIRTHHPQPKILDLGCSYGTLGALLKTDRTLDDLRDRYVSPDLRDLAWDDLAADDRAYFAAHAIPGAPIMLGTDAADLAVRYGLATGALDQGWTLNLEESEAPDSLRSGLRGVDLLAVAGVVGYLTEITMGRVMEAIDGPKPWVMALVMRMYPYDRIAETLSAHGLVTELVEGATFRRRRFASDQEQANVLAQLEALGLDPTGREAEGWYHAQLYISRPEGDPAPDLTGPLEL